MTDYFDSERQKRVGQSQPCPWFEWALKATGIALAALIVGLNLCGPALWQK